MFRPKEEVPKSKIHRTIAVAAGKGGVGKSTVAVNVAQALHAQGFRVGLLDTDIYGPSVRKMLPEDRMPQQKGETIIPALCRGIRMLSIAYFRNEFEAIAVRAPIANGIISQFMKDIEWGELDYLIIDFPPGTGDIQLTLSQQANLTAALLVTTPQDVALMDVRKAAHLFYQVKVPIVGIVENMSFYTDDAGKQIPLFGEGGGKRLAEELGVPLLGQIPIHPVISRNSDAGESLFPHTPIASIFSSIAANMQKHLEDQTLTSLIKEIRQKDRHHLQIVWSDGQIHDYRLSDLQKNCPCAGCKEKTPNVNPDVSAQKVTMVGRYALRIQFTQGCSHGIYELESLRNLAGRSA
jgi:ATP-binding protein involved in chromosome partitioning